MRIHPLAVVDPTARIGNQVVVGPFCVVEHDVVIGDDCVLESQVVVKQGTVLGEANHIFEGAVIGGLPQHLKMPERIGTVVIGSHNTIREHATVHRALHHDQATQVGDHNLLMAGVHVAHDCRVGSHTIFANNAMLAGHVAVEDRAYLSGNVAVHQFCRVGGYAMVGGLARVVKDVPPFVTIDGRSSYVVGLNTVGLRRNGFTNEDITQLKAAYRLIYRSGLKWQHILDRLRSEFAAGPAACFATFFASSTRGVVAERREPPATTLKWREDLGEKPSLRKRAG
ncbi:MAG TPA: acyl-ACP--UDP-N-acetylglucosamine O-acyltransferase [Pirellulales bacterium]|nr:acyl-ACP--UDP-N-acetylglucosamine O-acyltransferase [Pirellulales bacterium]